MNEIAITPDLIAAHGLKPDEYQRILDLIGREPSITAVSYTHLTLPTTPYV